MTERERLIELMKDAETKVQKTLKEKISLDLTEWLGIYADYLLANGVIVPPCKVGDTVYQLWGTRIREYKVDYFDIFANSVNFTFKIHLISDKWSDFIFSDDFGKTVFLTKEEAEKALEEMKK